MTLLFLLLFACDDTLFLPPEGGETTVPSGSDYCAVVQVYDASCVSCHSTAGASGGLDLEADPYAATVDVDSNAGGKLVVPGNAADSVLYQRMAGTSGSIMPPGGALDAAVIAVVGDWIDAGASADCTGTDDTASTTDDGYHPPGWDAPEVHGMALKFQTEADCRGCHGADLLGDYGPACESCHGPDWETDCTWCHGDKDSATAAPPEGLDDSTGPQLDTFAPHEAHLGSTLANVPCTTCHEVPTSALTPGHVFDDTTAGQAEVSFDVPATGGTWNAGTCTVYCHGDGLGEGTVAHTSGPKDCGSCHNDPAVPNDWATSGHHRKHLIEDVDCAECHGLTVDESPSIIDPSMHVNGTVDLDLPVTWNGKSCTGVCHGETHTNEVW